MKKIANLCLLIIFSLLPHLLFGQANIIDASFYSEALDENKNVDIYIPPGYDENPDLYYPVIYFLHGWGGSQNSAETIMIYADSLIRKGIIDPVVIVCAENGPAPFSGSFFMNSPIWGDYEDYNVNDLVKWIQSIGRAMPYKGYRALMGQSMGGYGCFRYGMLFKHKFRAIAAHGSPLNYDLLIEDFHNEVIAETGTEPPYFYKFDNSGIFTQLTFGTAGAFSPNLESPQDFIAPQIVEFPLDEMGKLIDSVYLKWKDNDPVNLLDLLDPADSVGIFFGDGENDELYFYPPNLAFRDTLTTAGHPFEFFSHPGGHGMPDAFKDRALKFIDSILPPPNQNVGLINSATQYQLKWTVSPNPVRSQAIIQFGLFEKQEVTIRLINIHGESVKLIFQGTLNSALQQIRFDVTELHSGLYFVRIEAGNAFKTKKIFVH